MVLALDVKEVDDSSAAIARNLLETGPEGARFSLVLSVLALGGERERCVRLSRQFPSDRHLSPDPLEYRGL